MSERTKIVFLEVSQVKFNLGEFVRVKPTQTHPNSHQLRKSYFSKKGQSLMEMALSMTVMLVLLGGIVDLGRAFFTFMALRDAVQEGAMYGSLHPTSTVEIKNQVRDSSSLIPNILTADDITVEILGPACTGNGLRVTAVYPNFPLTMPFMGTILGSQTITLRATVTATILSPWCSS